MKKQKNQTKYLDSTRNNSGVTPRPPSLVFKFVPIISALFVISCQSNNDSSNAMNLSTYIRPVIVTQQSRHNFVAKNDSRKSNADSLKVEIFANAENSLAEQSIDDDDDIIYSSLPNHNKTQSKQSEADLIKDNDNLDPEVAVNLKSIDDEPDEISDLENLMLTSSDEALTKTLPDSSISNLIDNNNSVNENPVNENFLLCNDNIYYKSWVDQFDTNWLHQNSQNYRSATARHKALSQARTNEFIKLVYPAIEKTGFDFPVLINQQVLEWIDYFRGSGHKSFIVWLKRGHAFLPEMEKVLEKHGLPKDLAYLSMIESGYSPKALSYAGAVGLWQFMPSTGREYGLKINDYVDERRSVKKSTEAAASYLSFLYSLFGSWHLAAASYNGGPGLVKRTLHNYGEDSSFFDLTSYGVVNKQTSAYVPKLIAAMIIAKNSDIFGFDISNIPPAPTTKSIALTRSITIQDLAKSLNIDKNILESLNPELRLGITPPPRFTSDGSYNLLVPASKYSQALAKINSLPNAPTQRLVAARIKRKETVKVFAARYHVSLASILGANSKLSSSSRLHAGQVVYLPVSLGSGQYDMLTSRHYASHQSRHNKTNMAKTKHKSRESRDHQVSASKHNSKKTSHTFSNSQKKKLAKKDDKKQSL